MSTVVTQAARRRFVDESPANEFWQTLHRLADQAFVPLSRALLAALSATRQTLRSAQRRLMLALRLDHGTGLVSDPLLAQATQAGQRVFQAQGRPVLTETVQRAGAATAATSQATLGLTVRWDMANPLVNQAIDQQVGLLIRGVTDESLRAVRNIMRTGFAEGQGIPTIARRMTDTIGLTDRQATAIQRMRAQLEAQGVAAGKVQQQVERATRRALRQRTILIARTESIRSSNLGQQLLWEQAEQQGLWTEDMRCFWSITPDSRLCSGCRQIPGMNAQGVPLHSPFTTPYGPVLHPPAHPACLPGDAHIATIAGISGVSKRWYDGELCIFTTSTNQRLAVTPNHPILTVSGWQAAKTLQYGNKVIHATLNQRCPSGIRMDDHDMPATIHEITEAFFRSGQVMPVPVPTTAPDFHGDGKYSQVAIIGTNSLLWNGDDASLHEPTTEQSFIDRQFPDVLNSAGFVAQLIERPRMQSAGLMGSLDLVCPLCFRHLRPLDTFSHGLAPQGNMALSEYAIDGPPARIEDFRQVLNGHPLLIQLADIVRIDIQFFSGHVYNLQTDSGWYIANEIVTHNCRCANVPRRATTL